MKKTILAAFCAALLVLAFSACAASQPAESSGIYSSAITEWPQNEYTAAIPEPQTGTPVSETVNGAIYGVALSGVSRQDCYAYLALLEENGFESAFPGEENEVSGGWIYTNANTSVTIAHSGNDMQIGITFEQL